MRKRMKIKAEKKPEWALVVRHQNIIPSLEICAVNCLCWDTYRKCPIYLKGGICGSWTPKDIGDADEVPEEVPYQWETALGSAEVKQSKGTIDPPKDEVDADVEEGEEEVEEDG